MTGASILHAIAGAPQRADAAALPGDAVCWLCAAPTVRGVDRLTWEGSNYTDQNKCRAAHSPWVCEVCAWACSWVPPPGWVASRADAKRTPMLRSYTHLWDDGAYQFVSKAQKASIRDWLRAVKHGPWFAAIADSGQKHTLPWVPINPQGGARGLVRFEETDVLIPDSTGWALVDRMTDLLTHGVTKAEIERGEYSPRSWLHMTEEVRSFERFDGDHRGSRWFALALWLAQRDEERHAAIVAARKDNDGRRSGTASRRPCRARIAQRISEARGIQSQALDATARAHPRSRADNDDGAGVGKRAGAGAERRRKQQEDLFGHR